jgi:hypothetical protein
MPWLAAPARRFRLAALFPRTIPPRTSLLFDETTHVGRWAAGRNYFEECALKGQDVASAERWRLLKALYREAAALSSVDREAFLRRAGESHEQLTIEVQRLLNVSGPTAEDVLAPLVTRSLTDEFELDAALTRLMRCVELLRLLRLGRLRAESDEPPCEH